MDQDSLFLNAEVNAGESDDVNVDSTSHVTEGELRLRRPDRQQVLLRPCSVEELLPPEHQVRTLWAVVERLDLSAFAASFKARGASPGRAATDPKLLVAL